MSSRREAIILMAAVCAEVALAQPCNSPPVAVSDIALNTGRTVVVDVLANDLEPDGEAMELTSLSTTCAGTLSEDLGLVTLEPAQVALQDCTIRYRARDERGFTSTLATVEVRVAPDIFFDGFETGNISRWSAASGGT